MKKIEIRRGVALSICLYKVRAWQEHASTVEV